MQWQNISIILPAFNEEAVISQTVERAAAFASSAFEDYEIIITDDGSDLSDKLKIIASVYNLVF
jgi:glycosyltransferase involved in cell wall biosynthesis